MKYLIFFLSAMLFVKCGQIKTKQNHLSFELTAYQSHNLSFEELDINANYHVAYIGNVILKTSDSSIMVLPLDTNKITLIFDLQGVKKEISVFPKPKKYFDYNWETLKLGEMPTGLSNEQLAVFRVFAYYRLLNKKIADFSLLTANNQSFDSKSLLGKVTLLNFWKYGCLPCLEEIPALNKLYDYYENDTSVQLLSMYKDDILLKNGQAFFNLIALLLILQNTRLQKLN